MFEQIGREYIAVLTDKAREFGGGDTDRIASAAFARFLHQHGIEFDWLDDLTFQIDTRFTIQARVSQSLDHDLVDIGQPTEQYTIVARIELELIVMQGIDYKARFEKLATEYGADTIPATQLQQLGDWLSCFPHLWPQLEGETDDDQHGRQSDRLHTDPHRQAHVGAGHA